MGPFTMRQCPLMSSYRRLTRCIASSRCPQATRRVADCFAERFIDQSSASGFREDKEGLA